MRLLAHRAISDSFEAQDPVRYQLERSTIINRRRKGPHPRGWDVYWLELQVRDLAGEGAAGTAVNPLRVDIAAAELWSNRSLSPLELDGRTVNAVTLERIAGEKLRAFLSSLPFYRKKIRERTEGRTASPTARAAFPVVSFSVEVVSFLAPVSCTISGCRFAWFGSNRNTNRWPSWPTAQTSLRLGLYISPIELLNRPLPTGSAAASAAPNQAFFAQSCLEKSCVLLCRKRRF
jgi:hypothetical protein